MSEYCAKVQTADAGSRLDLFLLGFAKNNSLGLSRTGIQKLIQGGCVELNDAQLLKPHHKVRENDEITVTVEEKQPAGIAAENIPLEIVYQDKDIAVINKPIGMVVHPAPGNANHTLVNALMFHVKQLSDINPFRPGIVHRLDKETSGLLVVAKNNESHLFLSEQFSEHSIKRIYYALVKGKVEFDENVIEASIQRHPIKRQSMAVGFGESAKYAKTHYRTLKRTGAYSLLELEPFTGRTHQLRVHLSFIGHPILGDEKYGSRNDFSRLALHAAVIGFVHPRTKKFVEFTSEMPREFKKFIEK